VPSVPSRRRFGGIGWSRWQRARSADWMCTSGTVLSATVQVGGASSDRVAQPLVFYSYQVNGELYQGHRVRCSTEAAAVVERCRAGAAVRVFYDPANPADSTLRF
jgi:hypothetical protein